MHVHCVMTCHSDAVLGTSLGTAESLLHSITRRAKNRHHARTTDGHYFQLARDNYELH